MKRRSVQQVVGGNLHKGYKKAVRLEVYEINTDLIVSERRRQGAASEGGCLIVAFCSAVIGIWLL